MNPAQSETPGMPGNSMRENREAPRASGSGTPDRPGEGDELYGQSLGGTRGDTGSEGARANPRPSIFWDSRISAGRPGRASGSRSGGRLSRSGCGRNCKQCGRSCASAGMSGLPKPGTGCGRWCRATSTTMRYRETSRRYRLSGGRWPVRGWRRSGVAVNGTAYRGGVSAQSLIAIYPCREFCRNPECALTPGTQGRSRMR